LHDGSVGVRPPQLDNNQTILADRAIEGACFGSKALSPESGWSPARQGGDYEVSLFRAKHSLHLLQHHHSINPASADPRAAHAAQGKLVTPEDGAITEARFYLQTTRKPRLLARREFGRSPRPQSHFAHALVPFREAAPSSHRRRHWRPRPLLSLSQTTHFSQSPLCNPGDVPTMQLCVPG
jgi:hypothetical protein